MDQQLLLPPVAKQSLSEADSLAMVRIFLNVSLACIAHMRELLPWSSSCFRVRYMGQINPDMDVGSGDLYSAFQDLAPKGVSRGQEIRILVRGGHRRADQILDMLEKGVFQALGCGYLHALQIFVAKPEDPQAVLESYSFRFTWNQGRVSSVQSSPTNHTFLLENFQKSFQAATRALLRSLKDLPRLPARRKLGMSLTYTDDCPILYQPTGFVNKDDVAEVDGPKICEALWQNVGSEVGSLKTGQHRVTIGVRPWCSEETAPTVDMEDAAMSKRLQAMQKTSSARSINLVSTIRESAPRAKRQNVAPEPQAKRMRTIEDPRWQNDTSSRQFHYNAGCERTRASETPEQAATSSTPGVLLKPAAAPEPESRTERLAHMMENYAQSQDFTMASGCEKQTSYDDFGQPVDEWGYWQDSTKALTTVSSLDQSVSTPGHRRKISISRMLINIDRSPSAESVSVDESTNGLMEIAPNASDSDTETPSLTNG